MGKKPKQPRNWHAVNAFQRHAGPMKSRKREKQAQRRDTEDQTPEQYIFYCRYYNSESDHFAMGSFIEKACAEAGVEFLYYRRIKTGHIPMIRECKIRGDKGVILAIVKPYEDFLYPNGVDYLDERLVDR